MRYPITNQNNFDLIRLLLALSVFIVHSAQLSQNEIFVSLSTYLNSRYAVYAFFIVSGFLIFSSYENSGSLKIFFKKRFFRIYPAYFSVIIITSILLFSISTVPWDEYFSRTWIKYLISNLATLNFLQPTLPGVFENNAIPAVNGALWTIKIEIMFYLSIPLIALLFSKYNKLIVLSILYILSIIYVEVLSGFAEEGSRNIYTLLAKQLPGQLSFFLAGAFLYYYFSNFKKFQYFYLILALIGVYLYIENGIWLFFPVSLGIVVIYMAVLFKYLGNFGKFGDFSFGVYIWHFPIIQTFIHFHILDKMPIFGSIALLLLIAGISFLSWKYIEKPFLQRKSHYVQVEG